MDIWINKNTERSVYYVVLGALLFGALTLLPELFGGKCDQPPVVIEPLPHRTFEGLGG